jgi:TPR repeat protein
MAGMLYGAGRGVRQDPAAALYWFELAAAAGHPRAPLLRDQHWSQLRSPVRERVEANATGWLAEHPVQLTCKGKFCIYPKWTKGPRWTIFERDQTFD